MTTKMLMKQAANSIRTLITEKEQLEKNAEITEFSKKLISTFVDKEMIVAEDILSKLAEFESKSMEELLIIEKALELGNSIGFSKIGEVSDRNELSGLTPEEKFIQETIGEFLVSEEI